jgi:hypothetical protein
MRIRLPVWPAPFLQLSDARRQRAQRVEVDREHERDKRQHGNDLGHAQAPIHRFKFHT